MNYNVWQSYCTGCEKPNPHRISFGGVNCFHFICWLAYLWCGLTLRAVDLALPSEDITELHK